jgi:hypothetical protein
LGAKELLLSVGCGAFHALGLPCRIKTVRVVETGMREREREGMVI